LLLSKRISNEELVRAGFLNGVFEVESESEGILDRVLNLVDKDFAKLKIASVLENKKLMKGPTVQTLGAQTLSETLAVVSSVEGAMGQKKKGNL
jgi:hypothetical protein